MTNSSILIKTPSEEWLDVLATEEGALGSITTVFSQSVKELPHLPDNTSGTSKPIFDRQIYQKIQLLNEVSLSLIRQTPKSVDSSSSEGHRAQADARETFGLLRKYDGVILERSEGTFWARLRENPGDFPTLEAEFDLVDLPTSDREIAIEGAPIVWTMGFEMLRGTLKKQSIIYVRRLNDISPDDAKKSRQAVDKLMNEISWEK